jgi:hypothetical protein
MTSMCLIVHELISAMCACCCLLCREGLEQAMAAVVEDAKAHAMSRMQER